MAFKEGIDLQFADREIIRAMGDEAYKAVEAAAQATLADANTMVPVRTGALKASGYYKMLPGDRPAAVVGYDAPYARIIHYNLAIKLRNGQHLWVQEAIKRTGIRMLRQAVKAFTDKMQGGQ